jgi:uncharacterized phage protein gp47/JayE
MSFPRPTLQDLVKRIYTDLVSKSGLSSPLKKSVLKAFSYAIAGAVYMLFGFLDFIYKQAFPTTCSEEVLIVWAYIFDIARKVASFSQREVQFTGVNGSVIEALTIVKWGDGTEFETQEEVTITLGVASVLVICKTAGIAGNLDADFKLNLITPISGVQSQATILSTNQIDGQEQEDVELWRGRILTKIKDPPHGGNLADYEAWALEIAGVTRAWVYPNYLGIGNVGIAFVNDAEEDIFPDPAKVAEVQEAIDIVRPVTAEVTVFAPVEDEIDFSIQLNPNTLAIRDAVSENLRDLFKRSAIPGGTVKISHVREAISLAVGEDDHVLISPVVDIVSATGYLATLGTPTYASIP